MRITLNLLFIIVLALPGCSTTPRAESADDPRRHRISSNVTSPRGGIMEVWGFIDASGNVVVEPKYYEVRPYRDGLSRVILDDMRTIGYIDRDGERVITLPPGTQEAGDFSEGLALVNAGGTPGEIDDVTVHGGRWGYIDKTGAWAIQPQFSITDEPRSMREWESLYFNYVYGFGAFHDGRAAVPVDGGWGFIDRSGELMIPGPYTHVRGFHAGHANVRNVVREQIGERAYQTSTVFEAVINTDGQVVWETDWSEFN